MGLPKIDLPLYTIEIPSTGKKVKIRPFTVKEEKILLTAQESDDADQILLSIKQIVNNCLDNYDIDSLALFDMEYLMIMLRAKSVDNKVEFEIKDPDTKENIKLKMDLGDVKVDRDPSHTNQIKISDEYTLFLKYPNIDNFSKLITKEKQSADDSYDVMVSCFDKLVSETEMYKFSDFTKKEVDEFVESLQGHTMKNVKNFFDTMPKIRHEIPYVNSKGDKKNFVIQGTESFFI